MLQRAARIFADEGLAGLVRRASRKVLGGPRVMEPRPDPVLAARIAEARSEHERLVGAFRTRCKALGHHGLDDHYWYHTVDLGSGLVTPGDYDYRDQLPAFGFPKDMTGMRVLDVGSATGFFAFEFERRGAQVVSVELPSLAAWDIIAAERDDVIQRLMAYHRADSPERAFERHLDGPFRFCQAVLGSRVQRCYSSVYDLTLAKLGGEKFDLVYAGDIVMHLFSPFRALDVLSGLCRGEILLTIEVPFPGPEELPLIAFRGHLSAEEGRTWWMPNRACVEQMLRRLGMKSVSLAGRYSGIARRAWFPYTREVIRASWE